MSPGAADMLVWENHPAPDDATIQDLPSTTRLVRLRTGAGSAVAFPSKTLEHRVTPVTRGERRSLLLLCRQAVAASAGADGFHINTIGGLLTD